MIRDRSKDHLTFKEQWDVVREGFKRGVKYDGCTAVPDFDFGADCCGEHDFNYQLGDITRAEADKRLFQCIHKKGYIGLAIIFYLGVRVFAGNVWKHYRIKDEAYFDPDVPPAP